jgi:hypothetical protein
MFARLYLNYRKRIPPEQLRAQTLDWLRKYQEKVESLTPEQLSASPFPGKWSAQEIIFHAVSGAKGMLRLCDLLRSQDVPDMDRSKAGRARIASKEDLITLCRNVIGMAEQFEYVSDTQRTCKHPLLGRWDFKGWLTINLVHLERHYKGLLKVAGSVH